MSGELPFWRDFGKVMNDFFEIISDFMKAVEEKNYEKVGRYIIAWMESEKK